MLGAREVILGVKVLLPKEPNKNQTQGVPVMAEVLKAETKAQLREPEGFSAVEAGGCTDRPHNDRPADGAAQNQTPRLSACMVKS